MRKAADVSSLEMVIHAAALCPVPVKEQMIELFGPILLKYYVATEGNGCTFFDSSQWLSHRGSVGLPIIVRSSSSMTTGSECPTGTPGTVWSAGATHFEYYRDPERPPARAARRPDEHGR